MAKPVIDKISAFDCNKGYTVTYNCNGMQPYYEEVWIYDAKNLSELVYHKKRASMKYSHVIYPETATISGTVAATIDKDIFAQKISYVEGSYYFVYGVTTLETEEYSWFLDGLPVDLNDYGIFVSDQVVVVGDRIEVTYYPPNGLENGKQYKILIKCYGENEEKETLISDAVWFQCFTSPILEFEGLNKTEPNEVSDSSLSVTLKYFQAEGEKIKSFQFQLLNEEKTLLSSSDTFYSLESHDTFTYTMFRNSTTYWIRAIGVTEYDTQIEALAQIHVMYKFPPAYSIIKTESESGTGIVTYSTDIRIITPDRDDYKYIKDEYIDLREDSITYREGFIVEDDYTIIVKLQEGCTGLIMTLLAGDHATKLECVEVGDGEHCRYKLTVYDVANLESIIYSDEQPLPEYTIDNEIIGIWIQRNNSLYDLTIVREGN